MAGVSWTRMNRGGLMRTRMSWIRPRLPATVLGVAMAASGASAGSDLHTREALARRPRQALAGGAGQAFGGCRGQGRGGYAGQVTPLPGGQFRSDALAHELVGGCLPHRQPPHQPQRCLQVLDGATHQAPGRIRGEDQGASARFPRSDRPLGVRGNDRCPCGPSHRRTAGMIWKRRTV
jgi:hypothetical protein